GYRFSLIARALGQQMQVFVEREFGLAIAEYRILTVLEDAAAPSIREIAYHSQIDKAQVTRCIANLVQRGLVVQNIDKSDRRLRNIKLTPAGRSVLVKALPFNKQRQLRLEGLLTESELKTLSKVLALFKGEVDQMLLEEEKKANPRIGSRRSARHRPSP